MTSAPHRSAASAWSPTPAEIARDAHQLVGNALGSAFAEHLKDPRLSSLLDAIRDGASVVDAASRFLLGEASGAGSPRQSERLAPRDVIAFYLALAAERVS